MRRFEFLSTVIGVFLLSRSPPVFFKLSLHRLERTRASRGRTLDGGGGRLRWMKAGRCLKSMRLLMNDCYDRSKRFMDQAQWGFTQGTCPTWNPVLLVGQCNSRQWYPQVLLHRQHQVQHPRRLHPPLDQFHAAQCQSHIFTSITRTDLKLRRYIHQ